jgi:hypothetical protein
VVIARSQYAELMEDWGWLRRPSFIPRTGQPGIALAFYCPRSCQFGLTSAPMVPHFVHTMRGSNDFTVRSRALQAHRAGLPEHQLAGRIGVLAEGNAGRNASQQPRQTLFALAERQRAEILPVEFQEVEGLQDRLAHLAAAVERIEDGDAIRAAHHSLAVERERLGQQLRSRGCDRGIAFGPVIAVPSQETHCQTIPPHDEPVAVVLDLITQPSPTGGLAARIGAQGWTKPSVRMLRGNMDPRNSRSPGAGGVVTMPRNSLRQPELNLDCCELRPCPLAYPSVPTTSLCTWC